jgi:prepilin-type N-terminal cleavage/methylation domain-containing protein
MDAQAFMAKWILKSQVNSHTAIPPLVQHQSSFLHAQHKALDFAGAPLINVNIKSINHFGRCSGMGFTLLEMIAVLAILAILASLSVPLFIDLNASANQKAIKAAVAELNSREIMFWLNAKNARNSWIDDATLFSQIDTDLGPSYHWSPRAKIDGRKLHFKDLMIKLKRIPSTATSAGKWEIIFSSG